MRKVLHALDLDRQVRGLALQAAYLASMRNQSRSRQDIGYGFYIAGTIRPQLFMMDDIGGMFKVATIPYQLKLCKEVL